MSTRILDCGDTAFSVEFGSTIAPDINARVMALHGAIAAARAAGRPGDALAGVVETVPSMRALLVIYDPLSTSRAELQPAIEALLAGGLAVAAKARHITLPCCYDDAEFAPDLAEVAQRTGVTTEEVVRLHLASDFRVYVVGFMPGLPYMAGLQKKLHLPRRASPRLRVPALSVAIATEMTVVYPFESPGGWHLIGRTPVAMFDARRGEQATTLAPGDAVRFSRIDRAAYDSLCAEAEHAPFDIARFVEVES
ncbi:MAG: 5-oxoprolinase subunit PxpB [Alphaproteobacteria bacterium]|nr:5-oxoprolinase subunit PxpB [Alphaproteobacteria bacterium]MCW5738633.1 5-oxoprolinase subunit PxpB [Alphaproteobacteria bacterium]